MSCHKYTWHNLIKLGKKKVLEIARQLGVFDRAIISFNKKQRGSYFKCCSIVYKALQSQSALRLKRVWYNIARDHTKCFKSAIITNHNDSRLGSIWNLRNGFIPRSQLV